MLNMFTRGFIPSVGKTPKYSLKDHPALKDVPETGDYLGWLNDDIIQVDVDDKDFAEKVFDMVRKEGVKCNVLETARGYHFYFKNTTVKSQSTHCYSACGIPCDYGLGEKERKVPLRLTIEKSETRYENGNPVEVKVHEQITRKWVQTYDEIDYLPAWLYPVSRKDYGVLTIDCRNQSLYNYILVLQPVGLSVDDIRLVINVINRHILKEPLSQKEIDVITRDEAFSEELFYDEKGKFMHDIFGNYMLNNANILTIDGQCNIYTKNGLYSNDPMNFERMMLGKIPHLKEAQRKEIYKYVVLQCNRDGHFADPKYIGLRDTILDLETLDEMAYTPNYILQNKLPYNYNPNAYHELLDKTLNKVCCNDPQIRMLIEEMIGYTLYRHNSMQSCFILTGEGSNGKSTILNLMKKLLGQENFTTLDLRELEDTFKPSELYNKLANIGDDISGRYIDNSSVFKKCVTGNGFMVQKKYAQPFMLESYATQIFSANEMPPVADKSDGFSRRIQIVPFCAKFSKYDEDYDPFIESKLMSDESIEYLLKLAIDGLRRVITNNKFTKTDKGDAELAEYLKYNNNVLEWLDEEPKIENESVSDVYMAYCVWCNMNGCKPIKKNTMGRELNKKGYVGSNKTINNKSVRVYVVKETE